MVVDICALLVQLFYRHTRLRLEEDEGQNLVALEHHEVLHNLGLFCSVLRHLLPENNLLALKLLLKVELQLVDVILVVFLQLLIAFHFRAVGAGLG